MLVNTDLFKEGRESKKGPSSPGDVVAKAYPGSLVAKKEISQGRLKASDESGGTPMHVQFTRHQVSWEVFVTGV